jgi:hypothetical protein
MAATALIKFLQGAVIGADGQALSGVTGSIVTVNNADNTDVHEWTIELLYAEPGSTLTTPPGTPVVLGTAVTNTPSATFNPDKPGSYRIRLTVEDILGNPDVDIRNFVVPLPGRGIVLPPYQKLPDPLPLLGSGEPGEKPDELNIGGQLFGWAGDNDTTRILLHQILKTIDSIESVQKITNVDSSPVTVNADEIEIVVVDRTSAVTINITDPFTERLFSVIDISGNARTAPITISLTGNIQPHAYSTYILRNAYEAINLVYNLISGDWVIVSRQKEPQIHSVTGPASYNILEGSEYIRVNTAGAVTVYMPTSPQLGDKHMIKDVTGNAATNNITINGNGNNIDGAATQVIALNYGSFTIVWGGSKWDRV